MADGIDELLGKLASMQREGNPTIFDWRRGFEEVSRFMPVPADVVYDPVLADGVPVEWSTPPGAAADKVLFYMHGGGGCIGSVATHRGLVAELARSAGVRALNVDFRLAPEYPFPAGLEDTVKAYCWLLAQGIEPGNVVFGGDSGGGGLAVATLMALRDRGVPLPAAAVCISPLTDLAHEGESMRTRADMDPIVRIDTSLVYAHHYLGGADPKTPLASPIYGEFPGLPPMYVLVGTREVLYDDSTRLAERARAAGIDVRFESWEGMIHIWPYFAAFIPDGRKAIDEIGAYIRQAVTKKAAA